MEKVTMTYNNLMRFGDSFKSAWVKLRDARERYGRKLESLEGYEGERRDAEAKAAQEAYEVEVEQIHARYTPEVNKWLDAMERGISKGSATPPSEEQIRLLQVLQMRENLSEAEVASAAEQLAGCEVAIGALEEIASRTGAPVGAVLSPHKSTSQRRADALSVLRDRANGLASWGGGDDNETVAEYYEVKRNGGRMPRHTFSAAQVARLQDVGTMSTGELVRALIDGTGVSYDDAAALG